MVRCIAHFPLPLRRRRKHLTGRSFFACILVAFSAIKLPKAVDEAPAFLRAEPFRFHARWSDAAADPGNAGMAGRCIGPRPCDQRSDHCTQPLQVGLANSQLCEVIQRVDDVADVIAG